MQDPATQQSADLLQGPVALAWCMQIFTVGFTLALAGVLWQTRRQTLPKTKTWTLGLVSLFALTATVLSTIQVFHYVTLQDKSQKTITTLTSLDALAFAPSGLAALVAQTYFGMRCYKLFDRSKWIGTLLLAAIFACAGSCGAVTVIAHVYRKSATEPLMIALVVWLWATAVTDTLMCALLLLKLARMKNGTRPATDSAIRRLMRYTFATAAPTALLAGVGATMQAITGRNDSCNIFFVVQALLPPAYLFCVVYSLALHPPAAQSFSGLRSPPEGLSLDSPKTPQMCRSLSHLVESTPYGTGRGRDISPLLPTHFVFPRPSETSFIKFETSQDMQDLGDIKLDVAPSHRSLDLIRNSSNATLHPSRCPSPVKA